MTRLSRDDAFRLQDRFEEFIQNVVGQNVEVKQTGDTFTVLVIQKTPKEKVKE